MKLSPAERAELIELLRARFEANMRRHRELSWTDIQAKLEAKPKKLWSLNEMERTGGEPDVVGYDHAGDARGLIRLGCQVLSSFTNLKHGLSLGPLTLPSALLFSLSEARERILEPVAYLRTGP